MKRVFLHTVARRPQVPYTEVLAFFSSVAATCNTIYRSAQCREKLREMIFETSIENALQELQHFQESAVIDEGVLRRLESLPKLQRIDVVLDEIDKWYFEARAPKRVSFSAPAGWYPKARFMKRRFYFHCGPTNSGKTHKALQSLMRAKSGVYCAPLKALASQVWQMVNNTIPCDLLIGDERRFGGSAEHVSCTIEMTPIDFQVDVGVVDEVQLIGDRDRGWAWTRAILGLPAREVHVCGEARSLDIIRALLQQTGESKSLTVVEHQRLLPLQVVPSLQGQVGNVENGDCFVCFSRKSVFDFFRRLKRIPGVTPHLIYGSLPFAVREKQSFEFNDGVARSASCPSSEIHVLISTDAIAFGLNMNIRRIVFTAIRKFDGKSNVELPHATVLQIAGRAGRFGLSFPSGLVTTLYEKDLNLIKRSIATPLSTIEHAGILPNAELLMVYCERMRRNGDPVKLLSPLLERFSQSIRSAGVFFTCDMSRSLIRVAACLDPVENLTLKDKIVFCFAPLSDSSENTLALLREYALQHADGREVALAVNKSLDVKSCDLLELEWAFRMCEMYCWLAWRFRKTFMFLEEGQKFKAVLSNAIEERLTRISR